MKERSDVGVQGERRNSDDREHEFHSFETFVDLGRGYPVTRSKLFKNRPTPCDLLFAS